MSEGGAMYREAILEHYRNPTCWGTSDPADVEHEGENPLCGDVLTITLALNDDGTVASGRFKGRGCAISQASADILMEHIAGRSLDDVIGMGRDEVLSLLGIEVTAVREKCALLPLLVTRDGILIHRGERDPGRTSTEDA